MRVLIVDDEKLILEELCDVVKKALPYAERRAFSIGEEAMAYAKENRIDIAFLDINMVGIDGMTMARKLQRMYPLINIIFCTGYSEYAMDAHDLYCSAYLLKPVTLEKVRKALSNLRYSSKKRREKPVIRCFGNFDIYYHGIPMHFKYSKTKELLAYLVDQRGADCHVQELMQALSGGEMKKSYFDNIRRDLLDFAISIDCKDMIRHSYGNLAIERNKVKCDYFDFLEGKTDDYNGEYMTQYAFAEQTREDLKTITGKEKKTLCAVQAMEDYFAVEPEKH